MTAIAARAGAPIGSLYQFFPSKDLLADALVARYAGHVATALDDIEQLAPSLDAEHLAARLLDVFVTYSDERSLVLGLLDARWEQPGVRPGMLRGNIRLRLDGILERWRPRIADDERQAVAVVLLQAMKSLVQMHDEPGFPGKALALAHWRKWVVAYLADIAG
jgi:AcrR family transcriptional regulator